MSILPPGANKIYKTKKEVVDNYQKKVASDKKLSLKEQKWSDDNIFELMDFMGSIDTWKLFVTDVVVYGSGGRASYRNIPVMKKPCAVFSGSHWRSRKSGEDKWFDPYEHYQIPGTNQFCQTFAMMYLTDSLPKKEKGGWTRNYKYSKDALEYINNYVMSVEFENKEYENKLRNASKNCLKKTNACVNIIEYPKL